LDPFSEELLLNLAEVERRLYRISSAKGLIQLAIEYHPESINPLLSLASLELQEKNYHDVVDISLCAIKIDPSNADAFQNLGSSFGRFFVIPLSAFTHELGL